MARISDNEPQSLMNCKTDNQGNLKEAGSTQESQPLKGWEFPKKLKKALATNLR
ncbi:hypothetical protein NIES4074_06880 [Cylindrospermum sp. NIES-4074]|jgi:hypothetical protein|nr:hypothetical protein NIES4074_06880 [Cylindrospermum sp. NIES-4074]